MERTGKRIISVLIALCMMFVLMPQLAPKAVATTTARTTALDLSSFSVTYNNGTGTATAYPTTSDITDSAEGWAWYHSENPALGYAANTLVLDGLNLVKGTSEGNALRLPAGSTIVLADGSSNTVLNNYDTSDRTSSNAAIFCNGALTIKGAGTLNAIGGKDSYSGIESVRSSGICTYPFNLTIESGTVIATGRESLHGYSCGIYGCVTVIDGHVMATGGGNSYTSFGIYTYGFPDSISISGGTVTAAGGEGTELSYGIYTNGNVVVSGGDVTATAGTSASNCGIYASLTVTGGTVRAASAGATSQSYGILAQYTMSQILSFSNGTVYAKSGAAPTSYAALSGSIADDGMTVMQNDGEGNYTLAASKNGQYYVYGGSTPATDIRITSGPVASATAGNVTVSGRTGAALSGSPAVTVTLTNCAFTGLAASDNVNSWFTNLPAGLSVTVQSVAGDNLSAVLAFSGTPAAASGAAMAITIPAAKLSTGSPLAVTTNSNAKFVIAAGITPRTTALDLTAASVTYAGGAGTGDPASGNITDTAEGWKWYHTAADGYDANTLVLDGLNLTTSGPAALTLPNDSTIVLADGSVNTVESTYGDDSTYGIDALNDLTIKGSGTLNTRGGDTTASSSYGIFCGGVFVIEDGSVNAWGGDCAPSGASYGIWSLNSITIQGGSVSARGGDCASGISYGLYNCIVGSLKVEGGSLIAESGNASVYSYGIKAQDAIFTGGSTIAKAGTSGFGSYSLYALSITTTGMTVKRYVDGFYSGDVEYLTAGSSIYANAANIKISLPVPSFAESGDGTEDDPYEIGTAEQLKELAEFVNTQNDTYGGACYKLTDDIVLNADLAGSPEQWSPIGADEESIFTGVFDGDGHTISGLYINDTEGSIPFVGLFGLVMGGTIENLGVTNGCITVADTDFAAVGGIVGFSSNSHIENCYNTCPISASGEHVMAGGIAGVQSISGLTVVNCYNTGSVTVIVSEDGDEACAGGIVGLNIESSIKNCYSTGLITGNASGGAVAYAGGIVGQNDLEDEGVIENTYFLDNSAVNGIGYDETTDAATDTGCIPKSDIEMKEAAFVQTLNFNITALGESYPNLSQWRAAGVAENGGYPVFSVPVATYALTIAGGGTGATAGDNYEEGAVVPISAGTRVGYTFSGWTTSGGGTFASAGSANTTFTMPGAAVTITANWTQDAPQDDDSTSSHHSSSSGAGGVQIIVNGQSQTAGTSTTTADSNGQTTTTVTVDTSRLQTILDSQGSGATVIIPVAGGSDVATGTLTGAMVKSMENKDATLVVQTDSGAYTIPASQINIDAVSRQLGTNVSLADITVTISISEPSAAMTQVVENAAEDGGYTIMIPAVDYTITCSYGGQTVSVSSFHAYVERAIAIPDGVDPAKITTGVVVNPDGTVYHVPTQIVLIDGKYYAVINSLTNSTYSVIWNPVEFSDVTNHWAKSSINNMGSRMIVSGTGYNRYEPDRSMTRAEFAAIIVKALGLEPGSGETGFHDVFTSDWYCGYIKTAVSYGIINGYGDGTFGPSDTITREQAMTMLARTMKLTGLESGLTSSEISSLTAAYTDGAAVSEYAKQSVTICLDAGIVNGHGNSAIAPKDCVTRAEVAVMVERLLKNSGLI